MTPYRARLCAVIAGLVMATGHAPIDAWPLVFLGGSAVALLWLRAATPRQALWIGWGAGAGYFAVSVSWIVNPFLVDVARHGWMAPFALVLMAGGLGLLWALAFWLARRMRWGLWGLVAMWAALEFARGWLFTGFPWGLVAYGVAKSPAIQWTAWVGPYGLSLLVLGLCAIAAAAIDRRSKRLALAGLSGLAILMGAGFWRAEGPLPAPTDVTLRIVQPNIAQRDKWQPDQMRVHFDALLALSDPQGADLVIWPETAVTELLNYAGPQLREIDAVTGDAQAVFGIQRIEGPRGFNSLVVLGPDAEPAQIYDKHHLVPFGEYMPFGTMLKAVGLKAFTAQYGYGYTAGSGPALLDLGRAGHALPLICYEAIFPRDLRGTARPDWLLQITNDAWFGRFSGPQQSLVQARVRAIEQGLPMIRAANTGISAIIDARGHILAQQPLGTSGALAGPLPGILPRTLYVLVGEWLFILLLAFATITGYATSGRKSR